MTDDPRAGQEAARLLAAAQDWLRTSAPHLAPVSDDGTPCSCPLCRVVSGVREADPDDVARFVDGAVAALGQLAVQAGGLASAARDRAAEADWPRADAGRAGADADEVDLEDVDDEYGEDLEQDEDLDVDLDEVDDGWPDTSARAVRRIPVERPAEG